MILAHWRHIKTLILVNIGSHNGLLPNNTKPVSNPMVTYDRMSSMGFNLRGMMLQKMLINSIPRAKRVEYMNTIICEAPCAVAFVIVGRQVVKRY